MYDILPFPNITATDTKEQVAQINNYLIQFKEALEFILANISADNLSPELRGQLNSLGADIKSAKEEQNEVVQQMAHKGISVSDVVNSQLFKEETIKGVKLNGRPLERDEERSVNVEVPTSFSVDFETGELIYTST